MLVDMEINKFNYFVFLDSKVRYKHVCLDLKSKSLKSFLILNKKYMFM